MWRERGVRVIAWTVNNSLQRVYLTNFLRVTTMSDSMDHVPLERMIRENEELRGEMQTEGFTPMYRDNMPEVRRITYRNFVRLSCPNHVK